ncbi:hypothetical protein [Hahella sp. NBU794]|uniref:hypothetical protein n=1 Tax=Hahella sp. NBU794 TaxID=3422590 RepID=UPI003D6DD993
MTDRSRKDSDLVAFVKTLPSVKNLKVYAPGEFEKAPPEQMSPAERRMLIRVLNSK